MPGDEATGKGNIYNLTGNVRSGSHAAVVVGKMCKKGRSVSLGSRFQIQACFQEAIWMNSAGLEKRTIWRIQ
jgi:hypothetical protein